MAGQRNHLDFNLLIGHSRLLLRISLLLLSAPAAVLLAKLPFAPTPFSYLSKSKVTNLLSVSVFPSNSYSLYFDLKTLQRILLNYNCFMRQLFGKQSFVTTPFSLVKEPVNLISYRIHVPMISLFQRIHIDLRGL